MFFGNPRVLQICPGREIHYILPNKDVALTDKLIAQVQRCPDGLGCGWPQPWGYHR